MMLSTACARGLLEFCFVTERIYPSQAFMERRGDALWPGRVPALQEPGLVDRSWAGRGSPCNGVRAAKRCPPGAPWTPRSHQQPRDSGASKA